GHHHQQGTGCDVHRATPGPDQTGRHLRPAVGRPPGPRRKRRLGRHDPPPLVLTVCASATFTATLAVDVSAGSVPETPPPDHDTLQVIVARSVNVPAPDDRV